MELKISPNDPLSLFGRTTLHEQIPATATLEQGVLMKELEEQEGYLGWGSSNEMKKGSLSNFLMISSCKDLSFLLRNTYAKETNVIRKEKKKIRLTTTVVRLRSSLHLYGLKWSTKKRSYYIDFKHETGKEIKLESYNMELKTSKQVECKIPKRKMQWTKDSR